MKADDPFREIIEHVTDYAIFRVDPDGRVTTWNSGVEQTLGYTEDEFIGMDSALLFTIPDQLAGVPARELATAARTGSASDDRWMRRKDGREIWVLGRTSAIRDDSGGLAGFAKIMRDRSDLKLLERSLRLSEARYRTLVEAANDAIITIDTDSAIIFANTSAERLFGWPPGGLLGQSLEVLMPDALVERHHAAIGAYLRSGVRRLDWTATELPGRTRTGEPIVLEVSFGESRTDDGHTFTAILRDVAERRRAGLAVERERELLEAIFEGVESGIVVCNAEGVLTHFNRKAREWHGGPMDAVAADAWAPRYHLYRPDGVTPLATPEIPLYRALRGEQVVDAEMMIVRPDVPPRRLLANGKPMRAADGTVLGAVVVMHDITDRHRTEERLRHASRLESVGRLGGGVAHEANNQMLVVLGAAEFLLRRTDLPAEAIDDVQHIRTAAERTAAITAQLLAFSRRQMLRPSVTDLNVVVGGLEAMLRRTVGENVRLEIVRSPAARPVLADAGQLGQVLINLALNARDAMPDGGTLTISTVDVTFTDDTAAARPDEAIRPGRHTGLIVTDSGHGMDAETLGHLFEPFFTTKPVGEGTGLGLATVYGIVKQSGGYIWAYSEVGVGTSFEIYLPVSERISGPQDVPAVAAIRGGTETVLVAEDEPGVRAMMARVLREQGYEVIEAADGETALAAARTCAGRIALAVLDVVMPGMRGGELAERLRADRADLRILFTSGYPGEHVAHRGLVHSGFAFLQKPFSPATFALRVRELIDAG